MNLRHQIFYTFLRVILTPYYATFGRYHWKVCHPTSSNYLLLTNHNTNWDFFYFGLAFPKMMYFVASEHIFRLGFTSKIIVHLVDPIARRKGSNAGDTVQEIIRRLKRGDNVCMMAEGNRSFSGETGFISPATASLVKNSGVGLITYTIHGGYLLNPRWSTKSRKGPIYGTMVHEYTADKISAMSETEILEHIREDLYVNAYEDPLTKGAKYKTKNPAENLETALFACPKCKSIGQLVSAGDRFSCKKCGLNARYTQEGRFEGTDVPFHSVLDWYHWEQQYIKEYVDSKEKEILFSDENVKLTRVSKDHENSLVGEGMLSLTKENLIVGNTNLHVQDIQKISIALRGMLLFTMKDGTYYEIKSDMPYSAVKYMMAIYRIQGREYI